MDAWREGLLDESLTDHFNSLTPDTGLLIGSKVTGSPAPFSFLLISVFTLFIYIFTSHLVQL